MLIIKWENSDTLNICKLVETDELNLWLNCYNSKYFKQLILNYCKTHVHV